MTWTSPSFEHQGLHRVTDGRQAQVLGAEGERELDVRTFCGTLAANVLSLGAGTPLGPEGPTLGPRGPRTRNLQPTDLAPSDFGIAPISRNIAVGSGRSPRWPASASIGMNPYCS